MYTLDRFARNRYDSAIYKAKLKRNGVRIFYAKQPMPDTPEGIILESVLEGYAEYYSENLARSIKRGLKENALHGIAMGSPVLGYKIGNDRQYEIDPVGAKAVRTIFTMYAEGKSKTQIVNWLNEHGFKTSRGNAFNKNSLSRILRNDKYIGVYRYDDVVLEDAVPPIIDKTLFDKVQATFRHNYTARAKAKAIEDYLLTTKVFCGHCGEPMVGESGTSKTGKVHHYYKCVNRKRKHNCEKKVEKKEWLERTVVEFTVQQVLTDENIEKISTRAMELIEKELQDTSVLIGLQERLKETNKRIKNLMSAIEQGIITPTTKERLEELEEERRDLEGQIAREEMKKPLLTKERIMYWLESFKRGDIEDVEYQRRIIDTLVNSVYVYDDGDKGRRLVLTFNISGNNTLTISSSDIERTAPPDSSYSNPILYGKGFGYVFLFAGCRAPDFVPKTIHSRQGRGKYAMNLKKVHHIAIIGSNYEKSRHFYVDLLGFSVIRENYRPERDDYKIDLQLDGMELELFIIKNCPKRPSYPEAYGLRHLAFAVDSVDDTVRELNKKGILTEPIRVDAYTGKKMTFFSDPDNLPLEIHE